MRVSRTSLAAGLLSAITFLPAVSAQTYSNCNPLTQGSCPPDSALGKTVNIDFTSGSSDSFTPQGNPTYDSNGVSFSVRQQGDSPLLTSKWYIMFGRVDVQLKAAPGVGIVSSFILQSDDLDEIDWEWLGADGSQVQSNYFGKGSTVSYSRGAFHADPNNQNEFQTYTIIWTAEQVVWQINGQTVRVLTPATAEANQYPQTPMQVKMGIWSGGDPSNAQGTIEWAGGVTNYGGGPYTMTVKSVQVQDYSTGSQYVYSGSSGNWQDITAVGGQVNSGGSPVDTAPPAIESSSGQPIPFGSTQSGYPWTPDTTTLSTAVAPTYSNYPGLPSGWTVTSSGKVIPPSSAPHTSHHAQSTSSPAVSAQALPSPGNEELLTTYNQQGFKTVITVPSGWATMVKSYNEQGFLITPTPIARPKQARDKVARAEAPSSAGAGRRGLASGGFFAACAVTVAFAAGTALLLA